MKPKKNKKYLKEILKFYKKHIKFYIGFCTIIVIKAIFAFMLAMYLADIISYMMANDFKNAFKYATIMIIIQFFNALLGWFNTYFYKNLENNVRYDLQQTVVKSALNIKMQYYDTMGSGVIVTRLTSDIDKLSEKFKILTEYIVNIMRRISYLIYLVILNYYLGIMVIISVLIVSILYMVRTHYLKKYKPAVKNQREVVSSRIIEIVRAVKDVKTLNCDDNTLKMLDIEQREYIKRDNKEYYIGNGLCKITEFAISLFEYLFMILSIILMAKLNLTAAIFYTCYLYKGHTFTLATDVGDFRYKLAECEVYAERLYNIIYPSLLDKDFYGTETISNFSGSVKFNNVNFCYVEDLPVLKNVNFSIEPKSTVALVGESGSGKSTITALLAHLYYKTSGEILFDGKEIDTLSKDFVKENIAVVNQFPYLFNLSLRDNFKMINNKITDEEIWKLCDKLNLTNFIETLPKKLDSVIGEGGCQLSGGQRQKLCIARALCRNVKILIFDEATSSLDNASQNEIMQVIEKLKNEITIIIIAHRLSTITYADSILLVKNGEIVGEGRHEDLINSNNYYKFLYNKSK